MGQPRYPSLYQINTRVYLGERTRVLGRPATLDDVPDHLLDWIASRGFDWVWFLGLWQTGASAREISRSNPEWRREYERTLPDLQDDDISGSPFAICDYMARQEFGGTQALVRLRDRVHERGLRLLGDFVPNHMAPDHAWVHDHPEYFVNGSEEDIAGEPQNYLRCATHAGEAIIAHGRDPYFDGWPDTVQLNYRHAGLRHAMMDQLTQVAGLVDGVRCDMAMLLLPNVFMQTWGDRSLPSDGTDPVDVSFWPEAIAQVKEKRPDFLFMAEVYWDLEYALQQEGFDYTYDKRLYDRLEEQDAPAVHGHLHADPWFQDHLARFLENHDEPRAAATFPPGVHEAAAIVTFFIPGLRFFHEGQFEGRRVRVSMHLGRRPDEPINEEIADFYNHLLDCLERPEVRDGSWRLLECRPAWDGNPTWDRFLAFSWEHETGRRLLVAVNYGPTQGQCYVAPDGLVPSEGDTFLLRDLMSPAAFEREGEDLRSGGLFLDMPAWGYHVFEVSAF